MRRFQLFRLGLFQLAAGAASVLFLGVVNRVMRVELGVDLFLVSLLVGGGHYLGALVAIPFGHHSDAHPLAGYRRSVYALGGALLTALALAASPHVAVWIAHNQHPLGLALGFAFFLFEGLTTYMAGTAYLSLIADLTTDRERGQATGVVWTLLMLGIILTGVTTGVVFRAYTFDGFAALMLAGGAITATLSFLGLAGQERRRPAAAAPAAPRSLRASLRLLLRNSQTRWFAGFLALSMFSFFMHDVILEPFGGEVFALDPGRTARFNAYLGTGVILGMLLGGLVLIPRFGKPRITGLGCWLMAGGFGLLAFASLSGQAGGLTPALTVLGFGSGLFTVGGVALMMDLTSAEHTGLFVGAWTLVQALAKGPASVAGGALQSGLASLGATAAQAYAGVFLLEGLGVLVSVALLARVGVQTFQRQVSALDAALAVD